MIPGEKRLRQSVGGRLIVNRSRAGVNEPSRAIAARAVRSSAKNRCLRPTL